MRTKTAWDIHLKKYRAEHPEESLKEQMQGASKTYKKDGKNETK